MKRHFVWSSLLVAGAVILTLMTAGTASAGLSDDEAINIVLIACPGPFSNHGEAQRCATLELNLLVAMGQITGHQKGTINATIARSIQCQEGGCTYGRLMYQVVSAAFGFPPVDKVEFGFLPIPDGTPDEVIDATVVGPVANISVLFLESDYTCKAGQLDTIVGTTPFPTGMTCFYSGYGGNDTYVLGVSTDGGANLVNNADGSMNPLSYGTYTLKLYGSGFGGSGTWYKLAVQFADGTVLLSDPFQQP